VYSDLTGKVAIVGGSTDGIGKAEAQARRVRSRRVVNGRNPAKVLRSSRDPGPWTSASSRAAFGDTSSARRWCRHDRRNSVVWDIVVANGGAEPSDAPKTLPNYFRERDPDFAEMCSSRWLSRAI